MSMVLATAAWLIGIWLAAQLGGDWRVWLAVASAELVALFLLRRQPLVRLLLLVSAVGALGGARYLISQPVIDSTQLAFYNGSQNVVVTGLVVDEPDVRDRSTNLRISAERLQLASGETVPVEGLLLAQVDRFPPMVYGMELSLRGQLETPPDDPDFSYRDYLAHQGVYSMMSRPSVTVLAIDQGNPIYQAIYRFKAYAHATINRLLPSPQSALLAGILLGNDNEMPQQLSDAFRATGLTHIIAISGFNIAILTAILVGLTEPFLPRRAAVVVAMSGIALYTILVGADASVVRAAVMGGIFLITTRWLGRGTYAYASLFLAAFVMTLVNPNTLWDVGFQLSFTATLGLMLYATPFTRWTEAKLSLLFERDLVKKMMGVLSEAVLITLAAQVLTLPLMIAYFKQVSLISLVANALVLPAQPGVMVWGGLATLAGMVFPVVGQLFAWVAWLFLTYTIVLVELFATVPWAVVTVEIPPLGIGLIYAAIAAITWVAKQPPDQRRQHLGRVRQDAVGRAVAVGSVFAMLLVGAWAFSQPDGLLHVHFLDVGQGDATLIQTPSGRQILVDGGQFPSVLRAHLGRDLPFWDRELDLVIATHPDDDHVAGLESVFERYRVGQLITNGQTSGHSDATVALLNAARKTETPLHSAEIGERIDLGDGIVLEVLHPNDSAEASDNDRSVVVRLVYDDFVLLLTGDAEQAAEEALLAQTTPLRATVLKAGHHGANTSSTTPFVSAVAPQISIISAGADNRFGHPAPEVLERLHGVDSAVLRTDQLGTIRVSTNGQQMWWQADRAPLP